MERKKTLTMSWKGLGDDDDDEHFFESFERAAGGIAAHDGGSSSSDDEFEDSRTSFSSNSQRFRILSKKPSTAAVAFAMPDFDYKVAGNSQGFRILSKKASTAAVAVAVPEFNYDMWMAAPGSITERRKKLLHGMGLDENKELLKMQSVAIGRAITRKFQNNAVDSGSGSGPPPLPPIPRAAAATAAASGGAAAADTITDSAPSATTADTATTDKAPITVSSSASVEQKAVTTSSTMPFLLVRSRSDGEVDGDSLSLSKLRKEELMGKISKQRLTRTCSEITLARPRMCPYTYFSPAIKDDTVLPASGDQEQSSKQHNRKLTTAISNGFSSFFLIKNLDTGKEFIVTGKDNGENGSWNRLNDLQTGKKLTMEEFEKSVGHSPLVKELMRRGTAAGGQTDRKQSANYLISKSLRMSKKTGAALLKNIKGVASGYFGEKEKSSEKETESPPPPQNPNPGLPPLPSSSNSNSEQSKSSSSSTSTSTSQQGKNEWVRVRVSGKSHKEFSALHLCQEFQAHEGCIWTIKFSWDGHYLASGGEDKVIQVYEVQECELAAAEEGNSTVPAAAVAAKPANKKDEKAPDYVHVPETVFSLSDKPFCTLKGHSDCVLDLSWSKCKLLLSSSMDKTVRLWDLETKACLKVFTHNDYVTCIQFNPIDDDFFMSGSLDAKVRIWSIPARSVVDWTDVHEMVTAISYTPDGQAALIGTHKGTCLMFSAEDNKLNQTSTIDLQPRKKAAQKKLTGFQFAPSNPTEVLVTTADSRIRIVEGTKLVHKFQGFRNANSQMAASFSPNGRHVVCASEDCQVYIWKYEEPKQGSNTAKARPLVVTKGFETFPCKDVAVAVPWPFTIKGDPQALSRNAKRNPSKRNLNPSPSSSQKPDKKEDPPPPPATAEPDTGGDGETTGGNGDNSGGGTVENGAGGDSVECSPETAAPAPATAEEVAAPPGEAAIARTESGVGDSMAASDGSSARQDDGAAISASPSSVGRSSSGKDGGQGAAAATAAASQPAAWGLVIATASLEGEIRCYQNFGLPRKVGGLF